MQRLSLLIVITFGLLLSACGIANYKGTCRATGTRESLTLGHGFRDGANSFLRDADSDFELISNISHYLGNETSAADKARMIVEQVGRKSNPVIAEYFRGIPNGHYSSINEYNIFWQNTVSVTIKTFDDWGPNDRFWSLSGSWGTERGVFSRGPK